MSKSIILEDEVRDGYSFDGQFILGAKQILGFDDTENNVKQGTGQLTTFNQLGFSCKKKQNKPDGWYLPGDISQVAIILETKSSDKDLDDPKWVKELLDNVEIANNLYEKVVGILYNGNEQRIFLNTKEIENAPKALQHKNYYKDLYSNQTIDTKQIYLTTMKINNLLHFKFGVNDYYDRMIFTACALVAKRYGAMLIKGMDYNLMHNSILNTLSKSLEKAKKQNQKLGILCETYSRIQMSIINNQEAIDSFIECVGVVSDLINSKYWNGEDVMGIFFNEFNRYKGKSENGQVFTPDHITSLMYRLIDVDMNDYVLDAACGSGAFLTKAMSNMIHEAGGATTKKAKEIMSNQLFGIEIDKRVYSLACANMLIHKDGKTNLEQMDSTSEEACNWIKTKNITKVLMNPPFEKKYHPDIIIKNVLNNCSKGVKAAFLLPDKKLEKFSKKWKKEILSKHRLTKIIKLPEKTFDEGVSVSIFIFECGVPQNNKKIFTCYLKDDGLERVKNQGRQDTKNKWNSIEDKIVEIVDTQTGDTTIKWIDSNVNLSYQVDEKPFEIYEEDFIKSMMDFLMFKEEINSKSFVDKLGKEVVYCSDVTIDEKTKVVSINIRGDMNEHED